MKTQNLFSLLPDTTEKEHFMNLLSGDRFKLERIISTGQCTPKGQWLEQNQAEWVILLTGATKLEFEQGHEFVEMRPGDFIQIPSGCRHRVDWTDPNSTTVWIAIHYERD
jgi:cupin 2 domain-containing protein